MEESVGPPISSPNLHMCDYHVLGPIKKLLKGHRFELNKDIKAVIVQWFEQQPREFSAEGIHWLMSHV
jgi:hypothetical protein